MHDLIAVVGAVGILIATSLSACCRMECIPMSCIENNIIFLTHKLIFEKQDETKIGDVLDSTLEEHQPLLYK
jgi:hypothetical protein